MTISVNHKCYDAKIAIKFRCYSAANPSCNRIQPFDYKPIFRKRYDFWTPKQIFPDLREALDVTL
jgi:hypothetical protein